MQEDLFKPFNIKSLELQNRFVRSATGDGTADISGTVSDESIELYRNLGRGGVGLIITGHAFVSPAGQAAPGQYGIYSDAMIPGLRRMVDAAHSGGAKIAVQISHAGLNSRYAKKKEKALQAVSEFPDTEVPYRVMTDGEVSEAAEAYVAAGLRAVEAGFDAVQLHGAHGYLISQFLSPLYNHRDDRWGGSALKRRSFPLLVLKDLRRAIGKDFPIFIKLGVRDEAEGGLTMEEGLETARALAANGIDAIEVSCGVGTAIKILHSNEPEKAYFRDEAAAVKSVSGVPVMAVGGIRSLEMAADIIDSGDADFISMCRPFMREPGLIARWAKGLKSNSTCVSCNRCMVARPANSRFDCARNRQGR
jgi:2,4-dienoyl-CoA reductase-like NADH-dependent reductase (Old Yellow Enzyme family)